MACDEMMEGVGLPKGLFDIDFSEEGIVNKEKEDLVDSNPWLTTVVLTIIPYSVDFYLLSRSGKWMQPLLKLLSTIPKNDLIIKSVNLYNYKD